MNVLYVPSCKYQTDVTGDWTAKIHKTSAVNDGYTFASESQKTASLWWCNAPLTSYNCILILSLQVFYQTEIVPILLDVPKDYNHLLWQMTYIVIILIFRLEYWDYSWILNHLPLKYKHLQYFREGDGQAKKKKKSSSNNDCIGLTESPWMTWPKLSRPALLCPRSPTVQPPPTLGWLSTRASTACWSRANDAGASLTFRKGKFNIWP